MRAVIQRVTKSSVSVGGEVTGSIKQGLTVLIGVEDGDTEKDAEYIASKTAGLRIFEDEDGKMNLSVKDIGGSILAVSQFTLLGDARKGRRPSYASAASPEEADKIFTRLVEKAKELPLKVESGVFRTHMKVELINDGPVTILLDSERLF